MQKSNTGGPEGSPEAELISAVLETYVLDLRFFAMRPAPSRASIARRQRRISDLLAEASSPWTANLCDWIGVDHEWFKDQLNGLAEKLGYEGTA